MNLQVAVESDFDEVVALANLAYRDGKASSAWTTEASYIEGQRLDGVSLRKSLADKPHAKLMIWRDEADLADGALLGTVWLEPEKRDVWYLGLLTVRPDMQNRQLGRSLLDKAEGYAKERGGKRIRMTVVNVRASLIAWYERRGYVLTGETEPFPYGDERFGKPLRDDLAFVVLEKEI
jgi:ribosomal protein S18 acetylase RimI-like enzyme